MKDLDKTNKLFDRLENTDARVQDFSDLLENLGSVEDKKKALWREIYQNAVVDRQNAGILFTDAYKSMTPGVTEHVTLGATLSKYLERMCKSNEQILRLAEMIDKSENRNIAIDHENIFSKIKD